NANGSWAFDLRDQLDHVDDGTNSENLQLQTVGGGSVSSIDFSSILTATDVDGDTVAGAAQGAFTIAVQDDIPVQNANNTVGGTVEEDDLSNAQSVGN